MNLLDEIPQLKGIIEKMLEGEQKISQSVHEAESLAVRVKVHVSLVQQKLSICKKLYGRTTPHVNILCVFFAVSRIKSKFTLSPALARIKYPKTLVGFSGAITLA